MSFPFKEAGFCDPKLWPVWLNSPRGRVLAGDFKVYVLLAISLKKYNFF
jgi:hypothetical protein